MTPISDSQIFHLNREAAAGRAAVTQRRSARAALADIRAGWMERHDVPFQLLNWEPITAPEATTALDETTQREAYVVLDADYFAPHAFPVGTDLTEAFPALFGIDGFADLVADAWTRPPLMVVTVAELEERGAATVAVETWERFENPVRWVLSADTRRSRADRALSFGQVRHWVCQWLDRNSDGLGGTPLGAEATETDAMLWLWANLDADAGQLSGAWQAMPYPLRVMTVVVGQCSVCDSRAGTEAVLRIRANQHASDNS